MLNISQPAQQHFLRILEQQGIPGLGIRLSAIHAGTARADCRLEFCEPGDLRGDEWSLECQGFVLYVAADSAAHLDAAEIDFQTGAAGGQLSIRAPGLKGKVPAADASVVERVRHILDTEITPMLASHGGRVALEAVEADGLVVLRFGGGCHGCGMVDVTLREGIEKTLKERIPEITGVRDATDHAQGAAPYMKRG
ncbi:MAG: NfuA family Fe-S biogenesis protein [Lysobacterales bacterium]